MTDVLKPEDPYSLIQGNWPAESETDYAEDAKTWTAFAKTYEDSAGTAQSAATHAAKEWLGQSGSTYLEGMQGFMSNLNAASSKAVYLSGQLTEAEGEISHAKSNIASVVTVYTPQIDAAKKAEEAGKKMSAGEGSADLISTAREAISTSKGNYQTQMDMVGQNLIRGGPPEEKPGAPAAAPEPSFASHTAGEARQASNTKMAQPDPGSTLPSGAPLPDNKPLTPPGKAATPSTPGSATPTAPSMPSAPSSGGSPSSGSPSSGGSPAASPSSPASGSPGGGGSPSSGQGGNSQNNQGGNSQNNSSTPSGGGDPLLTAINQQSNDIPFNPAPMTQLSGVTSSLCQAIPSTISQAASAAAPIAQPGPEAVGMPSAAPLGTGVTPGVPAVQPATMPPPSSTPAGAVAAEAQGSTVTNATMSKNARMIPLEGQPVSGGTQLSGAAGAADRRPAGFGMQGPGGGIGGGWVSAAAGAAASAGGLSDTADMPVGGFRTFLADLGAPERIAHRALACLRKQFEQAGWKDKTEQPLAVGVYRREGVRGTSFHAVYATADAISVWAYGVKIPAGVHPVGMVDGIDEVQAKKLIGYEDVRAKITRVMPETYGELVTLLDTVDQDTARYGQIIKAGEAFSATQSRGDYARVPADAAEAAVTNTIMKYEMRECATHLDRLQEEMIRHRWDRDVPAHGVEAATGMWQVAEAKRCLDLGMLSDAGYAIGQVQKP